MSLRGGEAPDAIPRECGSHPPFLPRAAAIAAPLLCHCEGAKPPKQSPASAGATPHPSRTRRRLPRRLRRLAMTGGCGSNPTILPREEEIAAPLLCHCEGAKPPKQSPASAGANPPFLPREEEIAAPPAAARNDRRVRQPPPSLPREEEIAAPPAAARNDRRVRQPPPARDQPNATTSNPPIPPARGGDCRATPVSLRGGEAPEAISRKCGSNPPFLSRAAAIAAPPAVARNDRRSA